MARKIKSLLIENLEFYVGIQLARYIQKQAHESERTGRINQISQHIIEAADTFDIN